jgi:N-acyl-D-aspartate/D-glutamate deacylase
MHDIVIKGGTIVDGTGTPAYAGDLAIDGDRITAVGAVDERGRRTIDADGALITPGWVDIHTHYDGQATWDSEMAPSSQHGVTTVVMGNCGVGFAPVRPGDEDFLIELMEGVEDIPGTALHEGIDWRWESFGEYLDALETRPRTLDVGAQVGHSALRAYVLGARAHEVDITAEEIGEIAALTEHAIRAGALGFSTSRTVQHKSKHGYIPGTDAVSDEIQAVAEAVSAAGGGVFQLLSDGLGAGPDLEWMSSVTGLPGVTVSYTLAQNPASPDEWRHRLDEARAARDVGRDIRPQVPARPTGMLFGLQSSFHTFTGRPTFRSLLDLPLAARAARLRDPDVRARVLAEQPRTKGRMATRLAENYGQIFRLGPDLDYEPTLDSSAAAVAAREGREPQEVVLDWLLEDDGQGFLFAPLGNYREGNHDVIHDMLEHPASVAGLSDGGAHCRIICDASFPTYLLTHWTRDRRRGPLLPVEHVVHKQTAATAATYGLTDRGMLRPGLLADVNVIDHAGLTLHGPRMVRDLPADGERLVQPVDGYVATVKSGQVTFDHGEATGALPGGVVRRRGADER